MHVLHGLGGMTDIGKQGFYQENRGFMQIDYLNEFLRLESYPSISKAAEALGLSQPLLSRHIQAIEKELGCTLVDRSKQRIEFTGAGKVLLARLQELIPYWEQSKQLTIAAGKSDNRLVIGGSLDNARVRGILFAAMEVSRIDLHPLDIVLDPSMGARSIDEGGADVLISYPLPNDIIKEHGLVSQPLFEDGISAILFKTNPLAQCSSLSLSDLRAERLVKLTGDFFNYGLWWSIIRKACEKEGFVPQSRNVFVKDPSSMPQFYIGQDVFLCPTQNARTGFWHANPLYVTVPVANATAQLLAYHRSGAETPALRQFLDIIESGSMLEE